MPDHNQGVTVGFLILFATATAFIVWLLVAGD